MENFYHIRTTKHFNNNNMTMTVGHQRYQLYTDSEGILREVRDGAGHPFISEAVAQALLESPAEAGWLITPVAEDEDEPQEEVISVDYADDGRLVQASGTLATRLKEALLQVKHRDTMLNVLETHVRELTDEITALKAEIVEWQREFHNIPRMSEPPAVEDEEEQIPAPMVRQGKLGRPRKNVATELRADDASVSSILAQASENPPVANLADLDDIPRK